MKTLRVKLVGKSPLLMHASKGEEPKELKNASPEEQAEFSTYRSVTGELIIPNANIFRCLMRGGSFVHMKGRGKATLEKVIAAAVMIEEPELPLNVKKFTVDGRGVVIPATKGRIIRYRPRIESWKTAMTVHYDDELISESDLKEAIQAAGARIGLMDFRPEKKGPFGRFSAEF